MYIYIVCIYISCAQGTAQLDHSWLTIKHLYDPAHELSKQYSPLEGLLVQPTTLNYFLRYLH